MNIFEFTLVVSAVSALAGFLGALTGLGGGVVITPVLTLLLGVDMRYAIGATLVSVIATSSGAAAAYVREGFSNIRIGMFLEIATTVGAVFGAYMAARTPLAALGVLFGGVLLFSAYLAARHRPEDRPACGPDPLAARLRLNGSFPTRTGPQPYAVCHVKTGFALMFGAGALSGLLGIGSGAMKVIAMDQAMRIPFKVSATTSNFMIGVTAAASAGVYLNRGYIDPGLAMPVTLGVLAGVVLAAIVVQAGGVPYLLRYGGRPQHYSVFRGEPSDLRGVAGILEGALALHSRSIIQLGLLILIATPVARVAFSLAAFALERDRAYVAITALVLCILLYSLAGAG